MQLSRQLISFGDSIIFINRAKTSWPKFKRLLDSRTKAPLGILEMIPSGALASIDEEVEMLVINLISTFEECYSLRERISNKKKNVHRLCNRTTSKKFPYFVRQTLDH